MAAPSSVIQTKAKRGIMTPSKMVVWGFNLIVGYTFLISFSSVFNQAGNIMPVIIILGAFLALISGIAFGKMSQYFNRNGGVLLYTRAAFGQKAGGIFGMFQLLQLPIVASTVAIGFAWAFTGINNLQNNVFILSGALILFLVLSIIPRYNFTTNRTSLLILWVMKWFIIVAMAILALVEIKHFTQNIAHNSARSSFQNYWTFTEATVTFFFAFGGFEAVASMTDDLEDSKHNMIKVLVMIIIFVCLFYIIYYFLIVGPLGVNSNPKSIDNVGIPIGGAYKTNDSFNPINSIFAKIFYNSDPSKLKFGAGALGTILSLLLVLTQIANKGASRLQAGWANTRIISAYASCGYLPYSFLSKNKYGQYVVAFWFDFVIAFIFSLLFIFFRIFKLNFLYSGALGVVAYISFFQYAGVLAAALWIKIRNKKIIPNRTHNISNAMAVLFATVLAFIVTLLCSFVADGIRQLYLYSKASALEKSNYDNTIWISVVILIAIFVVSLVVLVLSKIYNWTDHAQKLDEKLIEDEIDKIMGHPGHPEYRGPN